MMDKINEPNGLFRIVKLSEIAATISLVFTVSSGTALAQSLSEEQSRHLLNSESTVQTMELLTLPVAISLALEKNLDLLVVRREVEASEGQVAQGQVRPNPELAYSLEDQRAQTRTQSLQINLPVEMGGKRAARIAAAELGRDMAVADLHVRRAEIRTAVAAAFFEMLGAQERAVLAQDGVELAKKATDAVVKRVAAGKVTPVEATKARIAEAGVHVELAQAQSELRNARGRLVSLLGSNSPHFTRVSGNVEVLPVVPSFDNLQQRLFSSPNLRRAQLEVERRRSLVEIERSKRIPDVTFSLGLKRPNELQRDQLLFGVSLPLPLFDRNQGNLQEALKREDKARDELLALKLRASTEVMQARERLDAIGGEVDVLQRDVLPGAKSAYDAAIVGFENGKFNFLEVLDAQRTHFAAKSQYLKALAEAHRSAADIDRVLGDSTLNADKPTNQE